MNIFVLEAATREEGNKMMVIKLQQKPFFSLLECDSSENTFSWALGINLLLSSLTCFSQMRKWVGSKKGQG